MILPSAVATIALTAAFIGGFCFARWIDRALAREEALWGVRRKAWGALAQAKSVIARLALADTERV